MGGGNRNLHGILLSPEGLSPRGRGKPGNGYPPPAALGSIPAWAGETGTIPFSSSGTTVYPRVGGGNRRAAYADTANPGLSPRGRGKPGAGNPAAVLLRSIPAWAGETPRLIVAGGLPEVYPRVGGGNFAGRDDFPRLVGLSPRGRGKRNPFQDFAGIPRSIPAWAGETQDDRVGFRQVRVYPRVGGGNGVVGVDVGINPGLSPRGRGKPQDQHHQKHRAGSIPAWAGETATSNPFIHRWTVYPRVGGGNRGGRRGCRVGMGSIPAWAGETRVPEWRPRGREVYPRVGGGNDAGIAPGGVAGGLSPRGRGKPPHGADGRPRRRSIPAWAGET